MPVFDQGYQHWSGVLAGHSWRWLTVTRHGVRRGLKNRVVRTFLLLSWLPALALVFMLCVWGLIERKSDLVGPLIPMLSFIEPGLMADAKRYRVEVWTICFDRFLLIELWSAMVLVLLIGPSLISQDLRFNALPLYFSRPLRRVDYLVGKLGVIAAFLGLMIVLPAVIAWVLGLLFSLDVTIVRDTFGLMVSCVVYGVVVSLSAGLLVLALSSLSRSSRYVALFWLGIWFVGGVVSTVLHAVDRDQRRHAVYARVFNESEPAATAPATAGSASTSPAARPERARVRRASGEAWRQAREELAREEVRAAPGNWRPVVSYTANLSRIGQQLLGTNTAWQSVSRFQPESRRDRFLYDWMGPQYPWYWSAAVLVGLMGLSVWILNGRVKSLDRLR